MQVALSLLLPLLKWARQMPAALLWLVVKLARQSRAGRRRRRRPQPAWFGSIWYSGHWRREERIFDMFVVGGGDGGWVKLELRGICSSASPSESESLIKWIQDVGF